MGVVAGLAAAASAASIGSSIYGMANAGGGGQGGFYGGFMPPPVYTPAHQAEADTQYWNMANAMSSAGQNWANQAVPQIQAASLNAANNPYAAQQMAGAQAASQYGSGTLAPMQEASAASLYGAGNQILQQGFDPQQALYNRMQQQLQDQTNATNAMYGLSSSPYGAGVSNQAMSNFNIDWQNQQLNRQVQALQGAGKGFAGASDLGTAGAATQLAAGGLPYATYAGQQGDIINALNQGSQGTNAAYGLDQNALNALAAYMKLGQSATAVGQQGAGQSYNTMSDLGQNLGYGLQQFSGPLSSLFGGSQQSFDPFSASQGYMGTVGNYQSLYGSDPMANQIGYGGM